MGAVMIQRRHLFRLISYSLLGVLLIFLLIVYALYLSAQRKPKFYQKALAVSPELRQIQNETMRAKIIELHNAVQNTRQPWAFTVTDEDLNAYCAVELAGPELNMLPKEMVEPRVAFSPRQVDVACRLDQGSLTGVLHLALGLEVPEPNRLAIRIKTARLGTLPLSRDTPARMLVDALQKQGCDVQQSEVMGDPLLSFRLDLKSTTGKKMRLEEVEIHNGIVTLSGETESEENNADSTSRTP